MDGERHRDLIRAREQGYLYTLSSILYRRICEVHDGYPVVRKDHTLVLTLRDLCRLSKNLRESINSVGTGTFSTCEECGLERSSIRDLGCLNGCGSSPDSEHGLA